jgi:hypothetical protein
MPLSGRPAFSPTPKQRRSALALARLGISDREIARHLRVDRKTLVRSELGVEVFDARLRLKVRLWRPIVRDALDPHYGSRSNIERVLKQLGRSDTGDDGASDPENEANGGQNDRKDE